MVCAENRYIFALIVSIYLSSFLSGDEILGFYLFRSQEEGNEELEPLFDYTRVQPPDFFTFDGKSSFSKQVLFASKHSKLQFCVWGDYLGIILTSNSLATKF